MLSLTDTTPRGGTRQPRAACEYERVARAIRYLDQHADQRPSLDEVARHVGLSRYHFQRRFCRWAGVSPKRFLQFLTARQAQALLRSPRSLLEVALDVGLSGPGRLHDLIVAVDAVTPGDIRREGVGLTIRHGEHETPFGRCLIGVTHRGVCWLAFLDGRAPRRAHEAMRSHWPGATFEEDERGTRRVVRRVFDRAGERTGPLPLLVRGTNFQLKVWEALLRIPPGRVATYDQVARAIERPGAARSVGNAVACNPLAYLIPCHRVIRATGALGGYRWGTERKRVMLAWEALRTGAGG